MIYFLQIPNRNLKREDQIVLVDSQLQGPCDYRSDCLRIVDILGNQINACMRVMIQKHLNNLISNIEMEEVSIYYVFDRCRDKGFENIFFY